MGSFVQSVVLSTSNECTGCRPSLILKWQLSPVPPTSPSGRDFVIDVSILCRTRSSCLHEPARIPLVLSYTYTCKEQRLRFIFTPNLVMRLPSDLPPSTPPLTSGLKPKISRTVTRTKTAPTTPSLEDQANAVHNDMAGPHPDATHVIYPDRGSSPTSDRDTGRRDKQKGKQSVEANGRKDERLAYPPLVSSATPDHAVQSGRTQRARDRYYRRDRGDQRKRKRVEEQAELQSREARATAVQMGVGGVPEAVSTTTAGMPTLAEGSRCVIL